MLQKRVLTALLLIPLVLWLVLGASHALFSVFVSAVFLVAAWEWAGLSHLGLAWQRGLYCSVFIAFLWGVRFLPDWVFWVSAVILWASALYWVLSFPQKTATPSRWWSKAVVGLLLLAVAWQALISLHGEGNRIAILYMLLLIWTADSLAYFSGRRWGKTKLLPSVSPGKTWAGVWGALTGGVLLALSLPLWPVLGDVVGNWLLWIAFSAFLVPVSVLGDLLESVFKRQAEVKDSGSLLPGHGGMLDRIDSLLSVAPLFWLGVTVL